jgi:NTE family protein
MNSADESRRRDHVGSADLVLAGGGVKGIAHVGAIEVLEACGYDRFPRVVGTSVGALVGALVAAGAPAAEIERLLLKFDFRRLKDPGAIARVPLAGRPLTLLFKRGVYKGDAVREWLDCELKSRGLRTFAALRESAIARLGHEYEDGQWPFVALATDISRGRLVRLPEHYREYGLDPGEQLVADAVRASLSIPVFYVPVALGSSRVVDGGVLSNFAIGIFDADRPADARWPTFGMTLMRGSRVRPLGREFAQSLWPLLRVVPGRLPLLRFSEDLIGTAIVGQDFAQLDRDGVRQRTIQIDTDGFGIVEFKISDERKLELIEQGRKAAHAFIDCWRHHPDDGRPGVGAFPLPSQLAAGAS